MEENILILKIKEHLNNNGIVIISTYTKSWQFEKKHVNMFKTGKNGHPLVQRGKHWDDFNGASVKFYTYSKG